jgi:hypothetical protein
MAKKNVIINKVPYEGVEEVKIPLQEGGGSARYVETSDATAAAGDILTGKNAYVNGSLIGGSMPNNGKTDGTISAVDGTVTIPAGYTSGGTVQISEAEQGKVIPGNIKSGATILGVAGKSSVVETDDADATAGDILSGKTAYVNGQKITGTTTMPTISLLDGVLSIS